MLQAAALRCTVHSRCVIHVTRTTEQPFHVQDTELQQWGKQTQTSGSVQVMGLSSRE
jgi:hypothetical protein